MRKPYPTDLSDAQWAYLEGHLPTPEHNGRPRLHSLREILDAIFYVVRSGCAWRLLPHDFPPWKTVYHYSRFWRLDGTWERSTLPCASVCGSASRGTLSPAQALSTVSRSKRLAWEEKSAVTMVARRSKAENGI
jgi:transposase